MSIKKKIATAIATAGLLAGLFGSAFIPSAMARGGSGNVPAKGLSDWWVQSDDFADYNQDGIDGVSNGDSNDLPSKIVIAAHNDTADTDQSLGFYFEDSSGDAVENVDLSATSTGFLEVAWAYRERIHADGEGMTKRVDCDWSYLDNEAFGLTDAIAGVSNDGDIDQPFDDGNAGEYWLCVRVKDSTKPGSGTITVKANGATVYTIPFTVIGDLASLTISAKRGYTNVAEGNHEIDAFFTVVGKDSAGQVINATGDGRDVFLNDYTDYAITEAGTDDGDVIEDASGDTMNFVDNDFDFAQTLDLLANVCDAESYDDAGDADAGESYDLALEMENWDGDIITSNSVKILCTGPTSDAVLSNIVAETATGEADWAASDAGEADSDGVIGIYATVKDAAGRAMGLDNTIGFDITVDADFDTDLDLTEHATQVGPGGKMMLGYIVPDMSALAKYAYDVTIADFNLGNSDVTEELAKTLYYTAVSGIDLDYSLTRVRNAAKTVATWTADYGVACSNARITFDWENADGTKFGTVTRRANIDGVAKFSLARRNTTIFVYASGCDNYGAETDWVKARFR
jgi:hypothetical protein